MGRLMKLPDITPDDLQDNYMYRYYSLPPEVLSDELEIKYLTNILNHKVFFDEESEVHYGLIQIETRISKELFWTYISTLLHSNVGYFDKVMEYLVEHDNGEFCPVFNIVNIKAGQDTTEGIIASYDKTSKKQFQVCLINGTTEDVAAKLIIEFTDKQILFTSLKGAIDTTYLNYTSPKNEKEMLNRRDKDDYIKAQKIEAENLIKDLKVFEKMTKTKPQGVRIHGSRFVWKLKLFADMSFDKYKCQ